MSFRTLILLSVLIAVSLKPVQLFSQPGKIDSLKLLLVNAREDTNRFRILYNIAGAYWAGMRDMADLANTLKYEDAAFYVAKKLGYKFGIFDCLMCYGNIYAFQNKLAESKQYYLEAIELAKDMGDKKMLAAAYFEIAGNFFTYGNDAQRNVQNFPISLDYYFQALKLFEATGDKYQVAKCWLFIGRSYAWQYFFSMGNGNAQEIEKCSLNAIKFFKESGQATQKDLESGYLLLGRSQYFQGRYSRALELFYSTLKTAEAGNDALGKANIYLNIGRTYKGLGDSSVARGNTNHAAEMLAEAMKYFKLSLGLLTPTQAYGLTALCYLYIGDVQIYFKDFASSRKNLEEAISYTEKLKGAGTYQEIYQSLARLDSAEGNYKAALTHYNMYMAYKESNMNELAIGESLLYKAKYESGKKEDSLNQKQLVTETKLKAEKEQKYLYWIGLALLSLLAVFVFLNFRNQKKINKLAAEAYASERAELELQSLRAQLNPHFIFNCINSIDAFIHSNDKYNATVYLNKFAKLLRNILDSSRLTMISFSKDIDTLKLYVELEELRHENKFTTIFHIDEDLLNSDYKVPPLIIQPFVENAILHGIRNREGNDGLLEIEIKKTGRQIEYSIRDNGIGREAAGKIPQNKESSYGMQMSNDRVKIFNREATPSMQVNDLWNGKTAAGTEVKLYLNIV